MAGSRPDSKAQRRHRPAGREAGSARKRGKREERAWRGFWALVPFSPSPAVEGSWARRASRAPTAPAAWMVSQARPAPWVSRASKACLASLGSPESRYVLLSLC